MRIALLGLGRIGRELVRRTLHNPNFQYVAVGDTSGIIVNSDAFDAREMVEIVWMKEKGVRLKDHEGGHEYHESISSILSCRDMDVLVDATDAQTHDLLMEALESAHVVVSNKKPIADVSHTEFTRLVSKSMEERRILDFGTTVGAGLKIPDTIRTLGADGIESVSGCLSGTMNYVSQRINEDVPLSVAVKETMEPPRCYAESDPRIDLCGEDFARKLVIVGRLCGDRIDRDMVTVESIMPEEIKALDVDDFLRELPTLDPMMRLRIEKARREKKTIWYLGTADLQNGAYKIGFEEIPREDPITRARESDNVLKISPRLWRRPATIMGPGAGVTETVTGLISGLSTISTSFP